MRLKSTKTNKGTLSVAEFFSLILNSITQVHIFHFQTKSYSQHKALGSYYEDVTDLIDGLIECYQGKYGIVTNYSCMPYKDIGNPIEYFEKLHSTAEDAASLFSDSDLLNQLDEIKSLIKKTLYKLKNLQ